MMPYFATDKKQERRVHESEEIRVFEEIRTKELDYFTGTNQIAKY
jgi:hypothetical protein